MADRGRRRGHHQMRVKMAEDVQLAKLFDAAAWTGPWDTPDVHGRFAEANLACILDHHANAADVADRARAGEGLLP